MRIAGTSLNQRDESQKDWAFIFGRSILCLVSVGWLSIRLHFEMPLLFNLSFSVSSSEERQQYGERSPSPLSRATPLSSVFLITEKRMKNSAMVHTEARIFAGLAFCTLSLSLFCPPVSLIEYEATIHHVVTTNTYASWTRDETSTDPVPQVVKLNGFLLTTADLILVHAGRDTRAVPGT
jgi:hypothetical protein